MTHDFLPMAPQTEIPLVATHWLNAKLSGEERGSRFRCHWKQRQAPSLPTGAPYGANAVGAGSWAGIAGGEARGSSGGRALSASETPSPYLPPECVSAQQVSLENSRLTPGHPLAGALPPPPQHTHTFFLRGAVAGSLRLPHAGRASSRQPQGHPLTKDSQWQAN